MRARGATAAIGAVGAAAAGLALLRRRRADRAGDRAIRHGSRIARNANLARLGARVGADYATTAARKAFASTERRVELDHQRELRTAAQVAERLGHMKGVLMKVGQMASYLDEGLPLPLRQALAELQSQAPPMSAELAAAVITEQLGSPPEKLFVQWDPEPIAAASIGQVHRAIMIDPATGSERAVAVKVQYPGVAEAIEADLRNADLLGTLLSLGFSSLDPGEMVEEIKERLVEELDYRREAEHQRLFARRYRGHPTIHIPEVVEEFSTERVLTTELINGHTWAELQTWDQHERDLAAETIFRFVFRSLYGMRAFNGDPHPGNYLFHGDGKVTFLDFGLVRHFDEQEMDVFSRMVKAAAVDHDIAEFRRVVERAGMLRRVPSLTDDDVGAYFGRFYEAVREDGDMQWTPAFASSIVRHLFDRSSPVAQHATVPKAFVFIQRINLGLYAILGELGARGNYRRISEEIWPFFQGPPSTPMGEAEAAWMATVSDVT
jgi:predicted unusual protein kinase regulating ubiquinone biosynthesis (AarF/ABC1/UbiB family)